jgi:predicted permease
LFACAAAILTGALFGLGSVTRIWNTDASSAMKGQTTSASGRLSLSRDVLLPVQLAICSILVVASLVAVRGLARSMHAPLGFDPNGVAVAGFDLSLGRYGEVRGRAFQERTFEAIANLPGVETASYSSSVPLSIDQSTTAIYSGETTDFRPKNRHGATFYMVSPGYFRTVGTKFLTGRDFTVQDNTKAPQVAIVNRTLARRVVGTEQAVGRRFRLSAKIIVEIIGVVEDGKYETLTEAPKETVYYPILQTYSSTTLLLARTRRPEAELAAEMRKAIDRLDPNLAVYGAGGLREMLGLVYLPMRASVITLGAFGILALMLCLTGIYGLAAYSVSRRTREIGIRMALGARPAQVLNSVFGRLATLVAIGALTGIVLGTVAARILAGVVFEADPRDPIVILGSILTLAAVTVTMPNWRTSPSRSSPRSKPLLMISTSLYTCRTLAILDSNAGSRRST